MTRGKLTLGLVAVAVLVAALPAHAHLMNTGFGPFYDGATHLFFTP
jgi:urease accessory protein